MRFVFIIVYYCYFFVADENVANRPQNDTKILIEMWADVSVRFVLRFVASCGFTPDVKVWEVCFGKGGEFKEVARAFDLKGHSAGVHAFAFSNDSQR